MRKRIRKTAEQIFNEMSEFERLVFKARRGDKEATSELKATLDHHPELWRELGDLAAMSRRAVIKALANNDPLLAESVQRHADELEQELAGDRPTSLQRLAVQRFVATWLQLQHADAAAAKAGQDSLQRAKFWAQRQDQVARRYQRALKTLTQLLKGDSHKKSNEPASDDDLGNSDPAEVVVRLANRA
jgi:phosphate uptake regulator